MHDQELYRRGRHAGDTLRLSQCLRANALKLLLHFGGQAIAEAQRGTSLEVALGRCPLEPSLIWSLEGEEVARRVLEGAEGLERDIQLRSELQLRRMAPRALVVLGILCTLTLLAFWWPFYTYTAAI